jgi:hypothetical protein
MEKGGACYLREDKIKGVDKEGKGLPFILDKIR